jgi:hypothetical protein
MGRSPVRILDTAARESSEDLRRAGREPGRHDAGMAGASEQTQRITVVNANWEAGADGTDGTFRFMFVTEDGERHVVTTGAASATALVAIFRSDATPLWDPENRTVIAGGILGTWGP